MVHPSTAAAIEFDAVSKVYRRRNKPSFPAVTDLTLHISPSQILGFLGPNGSGKTTVLKMLCRITAPTRGRVRVNGCDTAREPDALRRQIRALVTEKQAVNLQLSIWENMLPREAAGDHALGSDLPRHAETKLRELGLWERRDESLRALSPGLRRQVAIASLMIADSPIIVVDEPMMGLDARSTLMVSRWLKERVQGNDTLVILATNQIDVVRRLCDQVVLMNQGRLVTHGSVAELFQPSGPESYELRVKGHLWRDWIDSCEGMTVTNQRNGESTLFVKAQDQSALYGVLQRVFGMGLSLISLHRVEVDWEELLQQTTTTFSAQVASQSEVSQL